MLQAAVLVAACFATSAALAGGDGPGTTDPFAESHNRLMRTADAQLQQVQDQAQSATREMPPQPPGKLPALSADVFAAVSPEAIAQAQRRLLALGVDAGRIFAEEGVPQALLLIAEVESGYDPQAISPKGARGLWQLMPETAVRFGLRVDEKEAETSLVSAKVDERTDTVRSTRAAARYLRELYLRFGDWLLALAAYNAGEARVESAIARAAARDPSASSKASFWQLAALGLLPEETRRYVPAVVSRL